MLWYLGAVDHQLFARSDPSRHRKGDQVQADTEGIKIEPGAGIVTVWIHLVQRGSPRVPQRAPIKGQKVRK